MIHIVVITEGTAEDREKVGNFFKKNPGWKIVTPDVWLFASRATAQDWRDFLAKQIPNLQFLIVRLTGFWGASGSAIQHVVQWLTNSRGWF